jgi:co-chaperonin GroES (HSP10)
MSGIRVDYGAPPRDVPWRRGSPGLESPLRSPNNCFIRGLSCDAKRENSCFSHSYDRSIDNIRPLHDRVIVKRLEGERKTASGIVIPDTAAEKPNQGEVIAVGPGKTADGGPHAKVADSLRGEAAIASAKLAYRSYQAVVAREENPGPA